MSWVGWHLPPPPHHRPSSSPPPPPTPPKYPNPLYHPNPPHHPHPLYCSSYSSSSSLYRWQCSSSKVLTLVSVDSILTILIILILLTFLIRYLAPPLLMTMLSSVDFAAGWQRRNDQTTADGRQQFSNKQWHPLICTEPQYIWMIADIISCTTQKWNLQNLIPNEKLSHIFFFLASCLIW